MNWDRLRREAVLAAEFVLAEVDIPPGDRIPIFEIIEDRGIWLSFEPSFDRLLGSYQRVGDVAGIAVNAARPIGLQRFTAAHELGHHELGHESHVDDREAIEGQGGNRNPNEIQAQTFAASLLMSELAIEERLEHRGLDPDSPDLSSVDVYRISAELGVSYRAAVIQLRSLRKISQRTADALYGRSPLEIKQKLLGGRRPDNVHASVWRLTPVDNGRSIVVDVGDELDVALPEARTAGYEWAVSDETTSAFLVVNDRYSSSTEAADPHLIGGTGTRHVTFKAHAAGTSRLHLRLAQPWDGGDQAQEFLVTVAAERLPTSEEGQGISVNQHSQLLVA